MVRRQTLTLLACLLQEDYVKWRGSLFFRFVSSLVDPELKRFGEFCLVHLLLARHPTMFYQHFIECVFHFNGYEKHKSERRYMYNMVCVCPFPHSPSRGGRWVVECMYCITRMFWEHQKIFANFARVDQFGTQKSAN